LLRTTPAAGAIGSCRYKLKDGNLEDFERILEVMRAHDAGYFFYIGGNDSMDTADRVSRLAQSEGYGLVVTGVPKTIDNDLGDDKFTIIDHTPGYGSAARYWAYLLQSVEEENRGMSGSEPVAVLQAMGRKSGYIPAAARLGDPDRRMPLQIYTAEAGHNLDSLLDNVRMQIGKSGRCIVVLSEGFDVGGLGEKHDAFGHIEYGASGSTVAQVVTNYLNEKGVYAKVAGTVPAAGQGNVTGQVPGIIQRSTSIHASTVDQDEAFAVGRKAVEIAVSEGTGFMATILRKSWERYEPVYDKVLLRTVANSVRQLPAQWLDKSGTDVTDDFIRYAMPLIGAGWPQVPLEKGLQRFARLKRVFVEKKCSPYVPVNFR
ncbi:MAG: diphosphate--fructose-6-phosphate 1-phosphotransferase, partial [Spirochaetales bacterium]